MHAREESESSRVYWIADFYCAAYREKGFGRHLFVETFTYITRICVSRKPGAHSSNVKILPVLFCMIIPRYLRKERTFDESTISTSMTGKGSSLLLLKSAIYSGYPGYVRSLKERDLRYTKESLPYFVQHCVPRAYSTASHCSISVEERGSSLQNIASWIYLLLDCNSRAPTQSRIKSRACDDIKAMASQFAV